MRVKSADASTRTDKIRSALDLYNKHQYPAAANAFESLITAGNPDVRLLYYTALANRDAGKPERAKQLFDYVIAHFPSSPEAISAKAMQAAPPTVAKAPAKADDTELPDSVKNALPKEMQELLKTEAGKQAVLEAMKGQDSNLQAIRHAEQAGKLNKSEAVTHSKQIAAVERNRPERPFSPSDIARDGAAGIDQSRFPNCWFEASMAALAQLPRGQKLISNMIRYGDGDSYVVRFPNDGQEYVVTQDLLKQTGIRDRAQWASILECAEIRKFPDNQGAEGSYGDQSRLEVGLGCITGCKADVILPAACTTQELSAFIGAAIKSSNPIICGTRGEGQMPMPEIVVPQHAYTVTDFNPSTNTVTIRNPHGSHSRRFELLSDPQHLEFQQSDDGVVKMSLPMFQKYFYSIARSFI